MVSLSNSLTVLADQIAVVHAEFVAASKVAYSSALLTGSLLLDAKDACRHGEWLPCLSRAGIAERQAQRLMSMARIGLTSDMVADLGGIAASLDFARQAVLPGNDEYLLIMHDDGTFEAAHGEREPDPPTYALIYRSPQHPSYFHVDGYDLRDPEHSYRVVGLKPVTGEVIRCAENGLRFSMVWMMVQKIMGLALRQSMVWTMRANRSGGTFEAAIAEFEAQRREGQITRPMAGDPITLESLGPERTAA